MCVCVSIGAFLVCVYAFARWQSIILTMRSRVTFNCSSCRLSKQLVHHSLKRIVCDCEVAHFNQHNYNNKEVDTLQSTKME